MFYKVTAPVADMKFSPSTFWRNADWSSSTTRKRPGYIEDKVLFVGNFDEVNIHLLPKVRRLRFWHSEQLADFLDPYHHRVQAGSSATIVADCKNKQQILSFSPTIYRFEEHGFAHVRNGEFVSRQVQYAIGSETLDFPKAMKRWGFQMLFTEHYDEIAIAAKQRGVYFDEQT